MKILVIGDSCIDEFIYCDIERICPEAPVPVLKPVKSQQNPGMAANVVINLESLGAEVDIATNTFEIKKTRYVDIRSGQMVLRVDENDSCEKYDGILDTKKQLGEWCKDIDFIKINEFEHKKNFEKIPNYPFILDKMIVTIGSKGCKYKDEIYPVPEVSVKDVSGAGDTFLAALVVAYLKNNDIKTAITFANECATKVVQKRGVATI